MQISSIFAVVTVEKSFIFSIFLSFFELIWIPFSKIIVVIFSLIKLEVPNVIINFAGLIF